MPDSHKACASAWLRSSALATFWMLAIDTPSGRADVMPNRCRFARSFGVANASSRAMAAAASDAEAPGSMVHHRKPARTNRADRAEGLRR